MSDFLQGMITGGALAIVPMLLVILLAAWDRR